MCQLGSAGIQTEIYPKHRIRESKNILAAMEHRRDILSSSHFTDEETEAERLEEIYPKSLATT